jgi:hypothetical protein
LRTVLDGRTHGAPIGAQGSVKGKLQRFAHPTLANGVDLVPAALEGLDHALVPLDAGAIAKDFFDLAAGHGISVGPSNSSEVSASTLLNTESRTPIFPTS